MARVGEGGRVRAALSQGRATMDAMDHPVLDIFGTETRPQDAPRAPLPTGEGTDRRTHADRQTQVDRQAQADRQTGADRQADRQPRLQHSASAAAAPRTPISHLERIVTTSADRIAWLRARAQGVTATDVARLTGPKAIEAVAREKRGGGPWFSGNAATAHGRAREPHIAQWVADHFSIAPSNALFHAEVERRHLATPDGVDDTGAVLAEIKTSGKDLTRIPRHYLRQIWWQQHVLGATRTLFVWEQHDEFVPIGPPRFQWVERDDAQIAILVEHAQRLLDRMHR